MILIIQSSPRHSTFVAGELIGNPSSTLSNIPTRRHRGHPRKNKAEQQQSGDTPEQGGGSSSNSADDERFDESLAALGRDSPAQVLFRR